MKRARDECVWPTLFDVYWLAKMIMAFLPELQLQHWLKHASAEMQLQLLRWIPNKLAHHDKAIVASMLQQNNIDAIELAQIDPACIVKSMLKNPINNSDFVMRLSRYMSKRNVSVRIEILSPIKRKDFMLTQCLKLMEPMICDGTVILIVDYGAIERFNPTILSWMPRIRHMHQDNGAGDRFRFYLALEERHWNQARYLWTAQNTLEVRIIPYCQFELHPGDSVMYNKYPLEWEISGSDDNCQTELSNSDSDYFYVRSNHSQLKRLDSVIEYTTHSEEQKTNLFCTDMRARIDEWRQKPWDELVWVFHKSCYVGHFHIIHDIWTRANTLQREELKSRLQDCMFSHSNASFEFIWQVDPCLISQQSVQWARCAFNQRNITLWKFLHAKRLISNDMLFDIRDNVWRKLASKPARFLKTVWQDCDVWTKLIPQLVDEAIKKRNADVLRFLCTKTTFPQSLIREQFLVFVKLDLHQVVIQFTDPSSIPLEELRLAYTHTFSSSQTKMMLTLFRVAPLSLLDMDLETFLQQQMLLTTCVSTKLCDMLLVLLENHTINAQTLYNIMHNYLLPPQARRLFASINFDIDNVEWNAPQKEDMTIRSWIVETIPRQTYT